MSDCQVCLWIEKKQNLLFEDESIAVLLSPEPAVAGHMVVVPKKHAPIIEAIPDNVLSSMFVAANKASMCAFEGLSAHGTNLLIRNGIPAGQKYNHSAIHIIPRSENDGIELSWEPKAADPSELDDVEQKLNDTPKEQSEEELTLIKKSLRRIP